MAKAKPKAAPPVQQRSLAPVVLLLALWWLMQGGGVLPVPGGKATAVVYVYEKDSGSVPSPVLAALNTLNSERKILATTFEQDTKDGTGDTPEPYKIPLAAAKEAGLPSLVVMNGSNVVRIVKAPKTESAVIEAVP